MTTSVPDSPAQLSATDAVVRSIAAAGWTVLREHPEKMLGADGGSTRLIASKGSARVLFVIQWAWQDIAVTMRHQAIFKEMGFRGLWLFCQEDFPIGQSIPSFKLSFDEKEQKFDVLLPSSIYHPKIVEEFPSLETTDPALLAEIRSLMWGQQIDLERFARGALTGRLRFAPMLNQRLPLQVNVADTSCWKCKERTRIVTSLAFVSSRVFSGTPDLIFTIYDFGDHMPRGADEIAQILPVDLLRQHGIGAIKPRFSRTEGRAYLSNGCVHCDALQGRFFEHEKYYAGTENSAIAFEIEAVVKASWVDSVSEPGSSFHLWWFDDRGSSTTGDAVG